MQFIAPNLINQNHNLLVFFEMLFNIIIYLLSFT